MARRDEHLKDPKQELYYSLLRRQDSFWPSVHSRTDHPVYLVVEMDLLSSIVGEGLIHRALVIHCSGVVFEEGLSIEKD